LYILADVQYRIALSNKSKDHYFYGVGLAGTIAKGKKGSKQNISAPASKQQISYASRDRDGDGIVDSADACPDQPGLAQFHGCPDSDRDGIPDNLDNCPTVPGVAKYSGCPIPDRDGDGINDEEDQCPDVPGFARYHGCPIPDTDKDGVNDEEDSCVNVPGLVELHGCPPISNEVIKTINLAAKNILFKTGSFELLPNSFSSLDTVVGILKKYSYLNLRIEGHTDNVGNREANQLLSENRANTIKTYLKQKGISESRLQAMGFGKDRPIASNNTSRGRAINRRVELTLYRQ
jgi:outer membrane protein OmpA-like peptidoglycan-associated protein